MEYEDHVKAVKEYGENWMDYVDYSRKEFDDPDKALSHANKKDMHGEGEVEVEQKVINEMGVVGWEPVEIIDCKGNRRPF